MMQGGPLSSVQRGAVVFGAGLLLAVNASAGCLDYGQRHQATLTGIAYARVDPGPPGYGEDPKHDAKERHFYLKLDRPVCVNAGAEGEDAVSNIREMQLVYFVRLPLERTWLGKHVAVSGWLMARASGHHWTKVLLVPVATRIVPVRPR